MTLASLKELLGRRKVRKYRAANLRLRDAELHFSRFSGLQYPSENDAEQRRIEKLRAKVAALNDALGGEGT